MADETRPGTSDGEPGGLHPGSELAGHVIEAEIGRGGMGVVYRARNLALERERALKVIAPALSADPVFSERFRRESRLAAQVEHPNVVTVHDAGESDGLLYIAMQLVDGDDLGVLVAREAPLEPARAARLIADVAAALDAAHERGLVHRDVKPSNVLVKRLRDGEQAFLTDFGISLSVASRTALTSAGRVLGSPDYIAPEQIEGRDLDARADVYSLGALACFVLTGEPPFPRERDMATLYAHANAPPPRLTERRPGLPPAVDEVIVTAMAKDPADRFGTAGELAEALASAVGARAPATATRVPRVPGPTTSRLPTLRPGRTTTIAIGLLVVVAIAVALFTGGDDDSPEREGLSGRVVATSQRVGGGLNALTFGAGRVWAVARNSGTLVGLDPRTLNVVSRTPIPGRPVSVAVGFGSLWVASLQRDSVYRVDPQTGELLRVISVGLRPTDVAVDEDSVWVSNAGASSVSRIDPGEDRAIREIAVGAEPNSIATGEGAVWAVNVGGGTLSKIDPTSSETLLRPAPTGERPTDLAVNAETVWVIDHLNGTLYRVDSETLEVTGRVEVGFGPRGVKFGFGSLWVANGSGDDVWRVDPESEQREGAPIVVGRNPSDVAIGGGSVWISNYDDGTISQVEPLDP